MTQLLPLETFRELLGYHPFHFWGLANTTYAPLTSACNGLVPEYSWQDVDAAGRHEIRAAIEIAEAKLRDLLGYYVAPRYIVDTLPWPKYVDNSVWRSQGSTDFSGSWISVKLRDTYLQALGTETLTLLGTVPPTFTDEDSDNLDDTWEVQVVTTETDARNIVAYVPTAERPLWDDSAYDYRIAPIKVSFSGGVATVRGRAWTAIKPMSYQGAGWASLDPIDPAIYLDNISIYRRTTETEGETVDNAQATLLWETIPCGGSPCICGNCLTYVPSNSSQDVAAVGKAAARVGVRNAREGIVLPSESVRAASTGTWYSNIWSTCREPDRVTVRYLAGYPLDPDGQMAYKFRIAVVRLAAAELGRPICACNAANRELYHWQFDLARAAGANSEQYSIAPNDLANPLGTLRGHVFAWKEVQRLRSQAGIATA